MTSIWIIPLRVLHVVSGAFWLGALILAGGFLLPAARATGPAGGQVLKHMVQVRRLPLFMATTVYLSLASGFLLYWRASGGFSPAWISTRYGMGWTVGGLLALSAAVFTESVNSPILRRIGRLSREMDAAGGPPPPEMLVTMKGLQGQLHRAVVIDGTLVALAAAAMASARYLG